MSEDFGDGGGERRLAVVDVADGADVDVRLRRIVGGVLIVAKNNLLVSFSIFCCARMSRLGADSSWTATVMDIQAQKGFSKAGIPGKRWDD